ncbi:MAG: hypothetical protein WBK55_07730 [Alphaproteobacteria bacterium]
MQNVDVNQIAISIADKITSELDVRIALIGVFGVAVGALIPGILSLFEKKIGYANDYYKSIVQRRIAAYEELENLIIALKTSVIDTDNKPYHLLFAQEDEGKAVYFRTQSIMRQSLWLSNKALRKLISFGDRMFNADRKDMVAFAKEHYKEIADWRHEIEKILAADMLELHNVKKFLKQKNKGNSKYRALHIKSSKQELESLE